MPISSKLPLKNKINTVHNLITFSIFFTNKNGGGVKFNPDFRSISEPFNISSIFGTYINFSSPSLPSILRLYYIYSLFYFSSGSFINPLPEKVFSKIGFMFYMRVLKRAQLIPMTHGTYIRW